MEATFGQIKSNRNFKRLSALAKVDIEVGLACIAQNLRKVAYKNAKTPKNNKNNGQNESEKSKSTPLLKIYQQYPQIYSIAA